MNYRDLEPIVHEAVMKILSAVYETGLVSEIDLTDVYRMFGITVPGEDPIIVDFTSPDWIKDFVMFDQSEDEEFQMKMVDMETGEVQTRTVSREEFEEMLDNADQLTEGELPEEVRKVIEEIEQSEEIDDLDPNRIIH